MGIMTKDEIIDNLTAIWDQPAVDAATKHPAFESFVKAMAERRYGPAALSSAWHFFHDGWKAGVDKTIAVMQEKVAERIRG